MKNKRAKSKSEDITVPVGTNKNVLSIKGDSDKVKADESRVEKNKKQGRVRSHKICFLKITGQAKTKSL